MIHLLPARLKQASGMIFLGSERISSLSSSSSEEPGRKAAWGDLLQGGGLGCWTDVDEVTRRKEKSKERKS